MPGLLFAPQGSQHSHISPPPQRLAAASAADTETLSRRKLQLSDVPLSESSTAAPPSAASGNKAVKQDPGIPQV